EEAVGPGTIYGPAFLVPASRPWTRAGSHRFPGDPSYAFALLQDPGRAEETSPLAVSSMLPPGSTNRRPQQKGNIEADTGLQHPLSTLQERRRRHPCKTRFRLAGCASTGRASNPLDRFERFQVTFPSPFPGLSPTSRIGPFFASSHQRNQRVDEKGLHYGRLGRKRGADVLVGGLDRHNWRFMRGGTHHDTHDATPTWLIFTTAVFGVVSADHINQFRHSKLAQSHEVGLSTGESAKTGYRAPAIAAASSTPARRGR